MFKKKKENISINYHQLSLYSINKMSLIFYQSLIRDISLMLYSSNDYDVIIQVGENQYIKKFYAHSIILKARSAYFKRALSAEWITKKNDLIEFKKPNIDPVVFEMIIK
jgi:hypothetical protein